MAHIKKTLQSPEKQVLISTLFLRRHYNRRLPGPVLTVTPAHAPTLFSGVLLVTIDQTEGSRCVVRAAKHRSADRRGDTGFHQFAAFLRD